ncbi:MAG: transglutaminase domain-containing protein [Anaerotignum sp.]|nr:transglutaminase domain-containing protein [Anaerotignum sp.]
MKKRWITILFTMIFCMGLLPACGGEETAYIDKAPLEEVKLEEEAAILASAPGAEPANMTQKTVEQGRVHQEKKSDKAVIDYTDTMDGYVQAQFTASTQKRLKAQVKGPTATYTYNMTAGKMETFPLSDGNGKYQVTVYENTTGNKYAVVSSVTFDVALKDEFAPFLHSNQYVDYAVAPKTIAKAAELTKDVADPLKKVEKVYDYVVKNMTYDKQKAAVVTSGYLPVLDNVLEAKKGICFDYASLMTGMLRSQGVPCKLVVGYAGSAYHAWINVWTEETGWVDGVIYFDGHAWHRMDPTFASSGKQSEAIMKYIGDGKNYTAKYLY